MIRQFLVILITYQLLIPFSSFGHADAAPFVPNDASLYQKLKTLFASGNTPYPMVEEAIQSLDSPASFKGCAGAYPNRGLQSILEEPYIVETSHTVQPALGPLQPPEVAYTITMMSKNAIKVFLSHGDTMGADGVLNTDKSLSFVNLEASEQCPALSNRSVATRFSSGISADGKSYDYDTLVCPDGKTANTVKTKLVGSYLVAHTQRINDEDFYFYCWK